MPERSQWLGRVRLLAVFIFIAALVILARPTPVLVALGAALALLGESIRLWAAGYLEKSVRLATSGPYARTQNPLYLGRLLILTGLGLAATSRWGINYIALLVGYAVFFLYYIPRKLRVEGDRLARIHGATYERYRASVPILFPSWRALPGEGDSWSFTRMIRNQEPLVLLGLVVTFAFLAWKLRAA